MNPNKLLKAIRVYAGMTIGQFAKLSEISESTVSYIESNKVHISQYYSAYAKQAGIPTWVIEFILSNDNTSKLPEDIRTSVILILEVYNKEEVSQTKPKIQKQAKLLIKQIRKNLRELDEILELN